MGEKAGIEGNVYQNKRTKKICILESQDMKHKTVMLRDEEGKSISQTFPTFRRDWVSYNGETNLKTSTQKTEETKEKEKVAEKKKVEPKKTEEKKEKKPRSTKDIKMRSDYSLEVQKMVDTAAEKKKFESFKTMIKKGECVVGKNGRSNIFEVWVNPENDKSVLCTTEDVFKLIKLPAGITHEVKEKWHLNYVMIVPMKNMESMIKALVSVLDDFTKIPEKKAPKEAKPTPKVTKPVPKKAEDKKPAAKKTTVKKEAK